MTVDEQQTVHGSRDREMVESLVAQIAWHKRLLADVDKTLNGQRELIESLRVELEDLRRTDPHQLQAAARILQSAYRGVWTSDLSICALAKAAVARVNDLEWACRILEQQLRAK